MRLSFTTRLFTAAVLALGSCHALAQAAQDPVLLSRQAVPIVGELAKDARFDLRRWGLEPSDLSLLDDAALLKKANLSGQAAQLKEAVAAGDPYATYLAAVQSAQSGDMEHAMEYVEKAAKLGVVRAVTSVALAEFVQATTEEQASAPYQWLKRMASTGNASSAYWFAQALLKSNQTSVVNQNVAWTAEGLNALSYAATAGFAPAQLMVAAMGFEKVNKGDKNPEVLRQAQALLGKAVAQGNADAIAYAKAHPEMAAAH
jgi:TPR repeat protein